MFDNGVDFNTMNTGAKISRTEYPHIDKPWIKYYNPEAIDADFEN